MQGETRELVRRAREWAQGIRGLPYVADRARLLEQLADIAERAAHQERDADATCVWTCDEDGNWDTACGGMFILIADTPKQNGMNFCCYCGRALTEADGRAPDTQTEGDDAS